jgi:hypothetical protein
MYRRGDTKEETVGVTFRATFEDLKEGEKSPGTMVAVFDDNVIALGTAVVRRGMARLRLPAARVGQMVRVFHTTIEEGIEVPTLARWRLRNGWCSVPICASHSHRCCSSTGGAPVAGYAAV